MFEGEHLDGRICQDFGSYDITSCGVNSQGNFYCSHYYHDENLPRRQTYHYINANGSTYFLNPDNSTLYENGKGMIRFDDGMGGGYIVRNGQRVPK